MDRDATAVRDGKPVVFSSLVGEVGARDVARWVERARGQWWGAGAAGTAGTAGAGLAR